MKKNRNGYSTDADVLKKLEEYPIVKCILEYRALSKTLFYLCRGYD
ncbi:MAG: hypothetical protein L6V91_01255 [Bacilli bacterium]|nr:MAG: hypothetical protein L6V91_01255 [Bacilli bacterium]